MFEPCAQKCARTVPRGGRVSNGPPLPDDAQAIAEASLRPSMPTVPIKTEEAQDLQSLHRARQLLLEFRTATINHIRGILTEYGVVLKVSAGKVEAELNRLVNNADDTRISPFLKQTLTAMQKELAGLAEKLEDFDRQIGLLRKIYGQAEKSSPFEEVFSSAQTGNHLNNLYGLR